MARMFSGERLRDERITANLSVEDVAVAVRRSSYSVREYEWGRVTPSVATLAHIADLLGRPLDTFFEEVTNAAA